MSILRPTIENPIQSQLLTLGLYDPSDPEPHPIRTYGLFDNDLQFMAEVISEYYNHHGTILSLGVFPADYRREGDR